MVKMRKSWRWMLSFLLVAGLAVWSIPARASAEGVAQSTFSSPEEAVAALVAAVRESDQDKLQAVFGPEAEDLIFSGDPVADLNGRQKFLKAYSEKNSLESLEGQRVVLHIGPNDYPFPIPLVKGERGWYFDTPAGKEEILNRRIGRNELRTIEVLQAYTAAQREYACLLPQDSEPAQFASKLISSEGKRDGLYWPAGEGEEESPFGPLIALAAEAGYQGELGDGEAEPFWGYYFKILTAQGPHATGGAFDYLVNGRMVLGFGMVAYPARYGSTGVKTFIVNQEGVVYEKDLGAETAAAATMTTYDPDESWRKSEETDRE
jgi:hypothetical protein